MLSYSRLGYNLFGNQIFQYAFLRTSARCLGVKFYCPSWLGDEVFELNDDSERELTPPNLPHQYIEPLWNYGFNEEALKIEDNTEIFGYFQSDKYSKEEDLLTWFRFKPEAIKQVKAKYENIDFSKTLAVHMRLGDFKAASDRLIPKQSFYRKAIKKIPTYENILVFSDEPALAKRMLAPLGWKKVQFVEGNKNYEDLYLMSQCRYLIFSISTFAWWAARLNTRPDKVVVMQKELFTSGFPGVTDLHMKGYHLVNSGCNPIWSNYWFRLIRRGKWDVLKASLKSKHDMAAIDRVIEHQRVKKKIS